MFIFFFIKTPTKKEWNARSSYAHHRDSTMESLNIDLLNIITFVETDNVLFFVLFFIENNLVFHSLGNNSNEMATYSVIK